MKLKSRYIGCFSDIHLGLGQDSKNWHKVALDFAKWSSEYYRKHLIDEIIIPGDIFHNRSEISVDTLTVAKEFFDYFKDFSAVYVSTGNHDCFKKDSSEINSIKLLDGWNNIHVIDNEPLILETIYENKTIGIIPWGVQLKDLPKCDIMFAHLEINSFHIGPFKICEHGLSHKDLFKTSPYIISGHFHKRDHRKFEKGEILYLGSPYQHNFGDTDDDRGIYIFDLKENTFKFVENTVSPKHIKLSMKSFIENPDQLFLDSDKMDDLTRNNIVSVIIDTKVDQEKILSLQTKIASMGPMSIRLDYQEPDEKLSPDGTDDYQGDDLLKNIEDYINNLDIEHKKEVVDYVKELYNTLI
jgi:DNA repair exonuclease SbcCD nuclease subunit